MRYNLCHPAIIHNPFRMNSTRLRIQLKLVLSVRKNECEKVLFIIIFASGTAMSVTVLVTVFAYTLTSI